MRTLAFILGLVTIVPNIINGAQIYKWVDENGKVHFSDKPPTDNKEATSISVENRVTPTKNTSSEGGAGKTAVERTTEANRWLSSSRYEASLARQKKQKAYQDTKRKQRQCNVLLQEYKDAQRASIIYDYDANGKRFNLNDKQKTHYLDDIKRELTSECGLDTQ